GIFMSLELLRGEGGLPLVLCDMKMPRHDGMWLLDQILQRHPSAAELTARGAADLLRAWIEEVDHSTELEESVERS
ncbi:MAG TPA: hypothetical protein VI504_08735, partial [Candidatus Eisenbacteria bacterium]